MIVLVGFGDWPRLGVAVRGRPAGVSDFGFRISERLGAAARGRGQGGARIFIAL